MLGLFLNLDEVEEKEMAPGMKARFVHTDNMTIAYWNVEAGAALPEHDHHHEQIASVIEGEFELVVDGERNVLKPGSVAVIAPNAVHSGRAIKDSRIIDVFCPARDDYR